MLLHTTNVSYAYPKQTVNIGGTNYDVYYKDTDSLPSVDLMSNDLVLFNNFLTNQDVMVSNKTLAGDSLSTYNLTSKTEYVRINGITLIDLLGRFGLD